MRIQLSREKPTDQIPDMSHDHLEQYLRTNPDQASANIDALVAEHEKIASEARPPLGEDESPSSAFLLSRRTNELKVAIKTVPSAELFEAICFGTIPGGNIARVSCGCYRSESRNSSRSVIPCVPIWCLQLRLHKADLP